MAFKQPLILLHSFYVQPSILLFALGRAFTRPDIQGQKSQTSAAATASSIQKTGVALVSVSSLVSVSVTAEHMAFLSLCPPNSPWIRFWLFSRHVLHTPPPFSGKSPCCDRCWYRMMSPCMFCVRLVEAGCEHRQSRSLPC